MIIWCGQLHTQQNNENLRKSTKYNAMNRAPLTRTWGQILSNLPDDSPLTPHQVKVN